MNLRGLFGGKWEIDPCKLSLPLGGQLIHNKNFSVFNPETETGEDRLFADGLQIIPVAEMISAWEAFSMKSKGPVFIAGPGKGNIQSIEAALIGAQPAAFVEYVGTWQGPFPVAPGVSLTAPDAFLWVASWIAEPGTSTILYSHACDLVEIHGHTLTASLPAVKPPDGFNKMRASVEGLAILTGVAACGGSDAKCGSI